MDNAFLFFFDAGLFVAYDVAAALLGWILGCWLCRLIGIPVGWSLALVPAAIWAGDRFRPRGEDEP